MGIDDNDAQDQNLHLVGEGSSKVSSVLHSHAFPRFDFDDGLQGHLRFANLVENEGFHNITNQEDNQWIEDYPHRTSAIQFSSSAVESIPENVWSEATSSESVEMLLKSVGQEERVLEVSDRSASITDVMDSIFQEKFVGSNVSSECEQAQETQNSGGKLETVIMSDKHDSSVDEKTIGKICDDVHQEACKSGNAGTSQHVENANRMSKNSNSEEPGYIVKGKENIMDNSTNSGKIVGTRTYSVEKLSVVLNIEYLDKSLVEGSSSVHEETKNGVESDIQQVTFGTSMVSLGNDQFETSEVSEINNVCKTLVGACSSAEMPAEAISHKDETAGNTDINVVGAADSQKNVEPSLLAEGCEGVDALAQTESNMDALMDVAAVESRNIASPDAPDVVQLPSEIVAKADAVIEDQPRSPLLVVSSLHDDNKKITKVGFISDSTFQKRAPEVEKDRVSDGAENALHGLVSDGDSDSSVGKLNMDPSEQATESNTGSLLDHKELMAGEDGVEHLNLAVNMSVKQHTSVDVSSPSECDGIPASVDKPQISFTNTKKNELSQSSNDKVEVTKDSMHERIPLSSITKEEKNCTFKVSASAGQIHSSSKNMKVSSVSSHGGQSDPIKLHEDSPVSQLSSSAATGSGSKGDTEQKPRKKSVGRETAEKSNNLKEQTPTRRSRKVGKSSPLLTPHGQVTPVSNPKPGGSTPISTSNLHNLNNSASIFRHSFINYQQIQLRAQILVYESLLSGMPPEEPHMIAAFGESDGGRRAWEATWHAYLERVRGQKSQPNNPGSSTPDQGNKIGPAQSIFFSGMSSPIINPIIPISSPLWNIPTPGVQNIAGYNPLWLSQSPFLGQWIASSPIAPFSARFPTLPITESVKLTTVKESGAPSIPVIPVDPSAGPATYPMVSSDQPSSDPKGRKRKKVVGSQFTTSAALSPPISINSKSISGNFISTISPAPTHDQPKRADQTIERIVTQEETGRKIEESKVQAADAAVHAAAAVDHCENVWSQLESQKNSGLVSDDEAKLASSAVSIAAASSVAKVAAAAAKIASNVAEQARLMADEVFLSSRKENQDHSSTTSIISAAKEAARRRIEAASFDSKHAENLDAIVKAAELAAEAVSLAGKVITIGNPLSLRKLVEAGPEGYWNSSQLSKLFNQEGYFDKQSIETPNDKDDSGNFTKNQMLTFDGISGSARSYENDKTTASGHKGLNVSKTVGTISELEFGLVPSDFEQNMPQRTSGIGKDIIKEGCLVEVLKDDDKKRAWFAAKVLTLRDGKAFVRYTELQSEKGLGKLKEWVPLEVEGEGSETPRLRSAHVMTTLQSLGTRKRNRTALTDSAWCSGDQVDVWVQDCWCEAVVLEANKNDITYVSVQLLGQGEISVVRSWHVRPTLIWKDGKWIEWSSLKGSHSVEGDTPHEKRQKFNTMVVEGKAEATLSKSVGLVNLGIHQRSTRSGLLREKSKVIFGVPKPGKKQKFMDVSTHLVADRYNQHNIPNDSRGSRNNSKNDAKEKQIAEVEPKVIKTRRKPPIPSFKTLTQKDRLKSSKPTSHNTSLSNENLLGQPNMMDFDSSNAEDAKETSTSKAVGKTAAADRNATKVLVKDKSTFEVEPRRSIRKIQPTSRLLEGLQSSLTVSKAHTVSHASQRSHNKVTSEVPQ